MNPVLFVVLLTAATGVGGLALGGGLAALVKRESPRGTSLLLSFTAGLMLSIVALDMVPEAAEALEDMAETEASLDREPAQAAEVAEALEMTEPDYGQPQEIPQEPPAVYRRFDAFA